MSNSQGKNTLAELFAAHPITNAFGTLCAGPILIGHRGASLEHPENTIPAFARALELGADMLELDVRLTKDSQVVVIHDATIDRTMHGKGAVKSFTLVELKAMAMQAPAGATNAGQTSTSTAAQIATLEEVFQAFPQAIIAVEIKDESWPLCVQVMRLIRRYKRFDRTSLVLISVRSTFAKGIRRAEPRLITGHTMTEAVRFTTLAKLRASRLFKAKGVTFEVPLKRGKIKVVTRHFVKAAHKKGVRVFVWTINDPAMIAKLCKMGVDGIFTDDLAKARSLVEQLKTGGK
jgi:glycerophosphoryl diester phosphodiesterase